MEGRTKKNRPTVFIPGPKKENNSIRKTDLVFVGRELMEFNHSLALVFYWFSFLVQKKENRCSFLLFFFFLTKIINTGKKKTFLKLQPSFQKKKQLFW
jgi:hypothetical protein